MVVLGAVRGGGPHPGALALLLHQLLEALVVHGQALLREQLLGQVVGEPVGVVQAEGVPRLDPGGPLALRPLDQLVEHLRAAVEGAAEALLLVAGPAPHRLSLRRQLRVGRRQEVQGAVGELIEEGRLQSQRPAAVDRAAHDPAEHVAALLVRGDDAVGDQRRRPARVVGDDAHRSGGLAALVVGAARELLREIDQRADGVDVVDGAGVLEDQGHPLHPHPGVDVLHRQLGQGAVLGQVVGHEDVVPELDEAVVVAAREVVRLRRTPRRGRSRAPSRGRTGPVGPACQKFSERGSWTIRSSGTPVRFQISIASSSGPESQLVVALEHGHPDPLGVEAVALDRELPAPGDRVLLEVVPKAPVAEHLEEGQVPVRVADLVDVRRAKAALDVGDPLRGRLLLSQEVRLERLHPRGRQQHRRVVHRRHEGRRGHDLVPALGEEVEVDLADLFGVHATSLGTPGVIGSYAMVPCPTTRSPSSRQATWPGAAPAKGSSSSMVASPSAPFGSSVQERVAEW